MAANAKKRDLKKLLQTVEKRKYPKLNPDQKLSLCMIVKNEEKHIARCLESVEGVVDEIIVVDTGSTDNTVEIAKKYGAKVYFYEWNNDFSEARNYSIKHSTGDWIFVLDADEEIAEESKEKIRAFLVDVGVDDIFYQLRIKNLNKDNQVYLQNYMVRLFKKGPNAKYYGRIHEYVIPPSGFINISDTDVQIIHHGYKEGIKEKVVGRNLPILESISSDQDNNDEYKSFINYYIGVSNKDIGKVDDAITYLRKSIDFIKNEDQKPHFAIYPYIQLMNTLLSYHRIDELKALLTEAKDDLKEIENTYEYWYFNGIPDYMEKNYKEAAKKFEKAVEIYNRKDLEHFRLSNDFALYFFVMLYLANTYAFLEDKENALKTLNKALAESEERFDYPQFKFNIARLFFKLGETEKSVELCNELLSEVEDNSKAEVTTFLTNIYMKNNMFSEAIRLQATVHDPEKVKPNWYAIIEALENEKYFPAAEKAYTTVLELLPTEARAYMGRSVARLIQNKTVDALSDLAMARKNSSDKDDKIKVGLLYFQVGQTVQAKVCIQEVLNEDPMEYQAHLYLASIEQSEGMLQDAKARLHNLTEMFPEDPRGFIQLGNLLLSSQSIDEAINVYEKVKGIDPDNAYIPYTLGLCYLEKDEKEKALAYLEEARKIDPDDEDLKALYQAVSEK